MNRTRKAIVVAAALVGCTIGVIRWTETQYCTPPRHVAGGICTR